MNRGEWRNLAAERVLDAQALLNAGRWACAYYVAGYAAECGLKACVLARVEKSGVIFDDPKFAEQVRIHKLDRLMKVADLEPRFFTAIAANPVLAGFWGVVSAWTEESRYQSKTKTDAQQLYEAITHNPDGILQWIQQHW